MKKTLAIIAPCFNEEKNIETFYKRLTDIISELDLAYRIHFIDDGSNDNTWQTIKKLKVHDNNINAIKLSKNFGQQAAISAGIKRAEADYVFFGR